MSRGQALERPSKEKMEEGRGPRLEAWKMSTSMAKTYQISVQQEHSTILSDWNSDGVLMPGVDFW